MSCIKLIVISMASLSLTALVSAAETDEIRARSEAGQPNVTETAERGPSGEAETLERKAREMLVEAERIRNHAADQRKAEMRERKRLLENLYREERELEELADRGDRLADVRRQAERVELELRALARQPHRGPANPHEAIARRLQHMRFAVEHLNQAGLPDVARRVAQRAEEMERQLHSKLPQPGGALMAEVMQQIDQMRNEIRRLRDQVDELRQHR